jgi:hypothetical protein
VTAFQTKLRLWKCQLKIGNLVHFKTCESIFLQSELQLSINDYSQKFEDLIFELEKRFHDFKTHEPKFAMFSGLSAIFSGLSDMFTGLFAVFSGLFAFDVEKADGLQMGLIDTRWDSL